MVIKVVIVPVGSDTRAHRHPTSVKGVDEAAAAAEVRARVIIVTRVTLHLVISTSHPWMIVAANLSRQRRTVTSGITSKERVGRTTSHPREVGSIVIGATLARRPEDVDETMMTIGEAEETTIAESRPIIEVTTRSPVLSEMTVETGAIIVHQTPATTRRRTQEAVVAITAVRTIGTTRQKIVILSEARIIEIITTRTRALIRAEVVVAAVAPLTTTSSRGREEKEEECTN